MYNYNSSYYSMGLTVIVVYIVIIGFAIAQLIAWCNIFKKVDYPWERLFVPIYGQYAQYKLADCGGIFWLEAIVGILGVIIASSTGSQALMLIVMLILAVFECIYSFRLAKVFGHGAGFAIGLILFRPIFIMILGFGSSYYEDGLYSEAEADDIQQRSWVCECGEINAGSRVTCTKCGALHKD